MDIFCLYVIRTVGDIETVKENVEGVRDGD